MKPRAMRTPPPPPHPTLGASRATPEEDAPSLLLSPQPGPMPAPAAEPAPPGDEEDEVLCRYCFEGPEAGELLSPCECKGGQKWVHLSCLRRWQRMVLVSQPTHPAFYERDPRHHECNVCKSKFSCPPPTRHELMASFTGPELGALVSEGCVIGAHEVFTQELERQMVGMSAIGQASSS